MNFLPNFLTPLRADRGGHVFLIMLALVTVVAPVLHLTMIRIIVIPAQAGIQAQLFRVPGFPPARE